MVTLPDVAEWYLSTQEQAPRSNLVMVDRPEQLQQHVPSQHSAIGKNGSQLFLDWMQLKQLPSQSDIPPRKGWDAGQPAWEVPPLGMPQGELGAATDEEAPNQEQGDNRNGVCPGQETERQAFDATPPTKSGAVGHSAAFRSVSFSSYLMNTCTTMALRSLTSSRDCTQQHRLQGNGKREFVVAERPWICSAQSTVGSQLETTQGLAENFVTGRQYMPVSKPLLLKCQITVKSNRIEAGMQLQLALVQTAKLATAALSISKGSLQRHIHTTVSTYPVEDAVLCFPLRKKVKAPLMAYFATTYRYLIEYLIEPLQKIKALKLCSSFCNALKLFANCQGCYTEEWSAKHKRQGNVRPTAITFLPEADCPDLRVYHNAGPITEWEREKKGKDTNRQLLGAFIQDAKCLLISRRNCSPCLLLPKAQQRGCSTTLEPQRQQHGTTTNDGVGPCTATWALHCCLGLMAHRDA
ncbi:hypothetical protein Anapl_02934 [Anas platyrhynchos]|uniref:Uncharacterized protein n=1 Tax=Anas platyrhynchos TaxID=8839 RepID=R0KZL7_ANAPL|nr:hypothetical protein Anapl_02934 [Anas platyrhynchos]